MFHFDIPREPIEPYEPEQPALAAEPEPEADDEGMEPLRLQLAAPDEEPEAPRAPELESLWTFPPPHQRESLALRFNAIRYDLESRGGRKPGQLKI